MTTLGIDLKRMRVASGLSIAEVGRRARVSPSCISMIESGDRDPSLATLRAIAKVFGRRVSIKMLKSNVRPSTGNETTPAV